jgi:hypothetical protein
MRRSGLTQPPPLPADDLAALRALEHAAARPARERAARIKEIREDLDATVGKAIIAGKVAFAEAEAALRPLVERVDVLTGAGRAELEDRGAGRDRLNTIQALAQRIREFLGSVRTLHLAEDQLRAFGRDERQDLDAVESKIRSDVQGVASAPREALDHGRRLRWQLAEAEAARTAAAQTGQALGTVAYAVEPEGRGQQRTARMEFDPIDGGRTP